MLIGGVNTVETGNNIKMLMEKHNISVADLADLLGVTIQTVYFWRAGTRVPSIDNLVVLADSVFFCKIDDIIVRL